MKLDYHVFASASLGNSRRVKILYPETQEGRYPVLYVHDGEYAFRKDTPESYECLSLDKALEKIQKKMIIVALPAMEWQKRTREYSPFPWIDEAKKYLSPGEEEGKKYLKFLTSEVMPYIEDNYPVLKGRENTYMLGCSLGAVITCYASAAYASLFSEFGLFSLASWGNEKALLLYLDEHRPPKDSSYFIRTGENEGIPRDLKTLGCCYPKLAEDLVAELRKDGISAIDFALNPGRAHKTAEWEKDMPDFLSFLFR